MKPETSLISFPFVLETLEDRIAPATITLGGNYSENPQLTSTGAETADSAIKTFFNSSGDHYYLKLNKGDKLLFDADGTEGPGAAVNWIEIKAGTAYVFLTDDGNGLIELDELTGLSVGGKASLKVSSDVNGSIVTNLNGATGAFLGDTLADGASNTIAELSVAGSINGSLLSLGAISKVSAQGDIEQIRTGSATSGFTFDFGGDTGAGEGTAGVFVPGAKVAGPSITSVQATNMVALVAGAGGAQGVGGSITKVTLTGEDGSLIVWAGDGGNGNSSVLNGGAGGKVAELTLLAGEQDAVGFNIVAGDGGEGFYASAKKTGKGGAGGVLDNVTIGAEYDKSSKSWKPTETLFAGAMVVAGGSGGGGKDGGAGGKVSNVFVFNEDAPIAISGGGGGDAAFETSTKDGVGGAITTVTAVSLATSESSASKVSLSGGAGGKPLSLPMTQNYGTGAAGGAVTDAVVGALEVSIQGGAGSSGKSGGAGGAVSKISGETPYVASREVSLRGGDGGTGFEKNGGAGGSVSGAAFDNEAYIYTLPGVAPSEAEWINTSPTTAGENKTINVPARNVGIDFTYGDVEIVFNDVTIESSVYGDVELRSSLDGTLEVDGTVYGRILLTSGIFIAGDLRVDGPSDGVFISSWEYNEETDNYEQVLTPFTEELYAEYVGGEVTINETPSGGPEAWQIEGYDLSVQGGSGGSGAATGGNGGEISSSNFYSAPYPFESSYVEGRDLSWKALAGNGGNGGSKAGTGGNLAKSYFSASTTDSAQFSEVSFAAGNGGSALVKGSGGAGGSVRGVGAYFNDGVASSETSVLLAAGNGGSGVGGGSGGVGGSVVKDGHGVDIYATLSATIRAGNGGDSGGAAPGAGGSIADLVAETYEYWPSTGEDIRLVEILAGQAGGGDSTKGATGGSIKNVSIMSRTGANFELTAGNGSYGGAGGNIENLSQYGSNTLYTWEGEQSVMYLNSNPFSVNATAGNGSGAGAGGSVKNVNLVAPAADHQYVFTAGEGGSGSKPGAGGAVDKVSITETATVTIYEYPSNKPKKYNLGFGYEVEGFSGVGSVELIGGNGGSSTGAANGANGGDIKNVSWNIDLLAKALMVGQGGSSTDGSPGHVGKIINVNPVPSDS